MKFLRVGWGIWAFVAFYIYLAIHALSGAQGLMGWAEAKAEIAQHDSTLRQLISERETLETRAARLDRRELHIDSLDILAREKLFLSHPDEIVVFLDADSVVID